MAPKLFARWPRLRTPRDSYPVIPPGARDTYPALAADLDALDADVAPEFRRFDLAAQRYQNRYRRGQVIVLLGSVLTSGFGVLQALLPDQRWPGLVLLVVGGALAASTRSSTELDTQRDYLGERAKAERLRAVYFRFLSRTGRYAGEDRRTQLQRAVVAIKHGEEPR